MSGELAYVADCRYCGRSIYVAICSDGKWRTFEKDVMPAAPEHVWAWRKRQGMQENELSPGHRLHYCAQYHAPAAGISDMLRDLASKEAADNHIHPATEESA